jgi:acyl-CoA-dependent ceramide synthase
MSSQPTWWYETEQFWLSYPQYRIRGDLKAYYLLPFSFWLQQLLFMVLGLEIPRSDYYELVAHARRVLGILLEALSQLANRPLARSACQHILTLWLIGTSYTMDLTCEAYPYPLPLCEAI